MRAPVVTLPSRIAAFQADASAPPDTSPAAGTERPVAEPRGEGRFEALLITEGEWTDDGRYPEPDSVEWREPPLPLEYAPASQEGHEEIVVGGAITRIWRDDAGQILAEGVFSSDEIGQELRQAVSDGMLTWISIVPASVESTIRIEADEGEDLPELIAPIEEGEIEIPSDTRLPLEIIHHMVLISATVLSQPAQGTTWIRVVDESQDVVESGEPDGENEEEVVAAGGPLLPSADWFADPGFGVTDADDSRLVLQPNGRYACPLTVTSDGRVFGHIAEWGTCHTGRSGCLVPPHSPSGYADFAHGVRETAEGKEVRVGQITLVGGHAPLSLDARGAAAHYDETRSAVADVAVGEDEHGPWIAGALRSGVTDEQIAVLRASALSGDWRYLRGALELVAVAAVNVPGFPIRRAVAASARLLDGEVHALVAGGVISGAGFSTLEEVLLPLAVKELNRRALVSLDQRALSRPRR